MAVLRQRVKHCTCYTQSRVIVIRKQLPAVMLNELHFYIIYMTQLLKTN